MKRYDRRYDDCMMQEYEDGDWAKFKDCDKLIDLVHRLKSGLHSISLGSQNSMTGKEDLGKKARQLIAEIEKVKL